MMVVRLRGCVDVGNVVGGAGQPRGPPTGERGHRAAQLA